MIGAERTKSRIFQEEELDLVILQQRLGRDLHAHVAQNGGGAGADLVDPGQDLVDVVRADRGDVEDGEPGVLVGNSLVGPGDVLEEAVLGDDDAVVEVVELVEPVGVLGVLGVPAPGDLDVHRGELPVLLPDDDDPVAHLEADLVQPGGGHHRLEVAVGVRLLVRQPAVQHLDVLVEVPDVGDEAVAGELPAGERGVVRAGQQGQRVRLPVGDVQLPGGCPGCAARRP